VRPTSQFSPGDSVINEEVKGNTEKEEEEEDNNASEEACDESFEVVVDVDDEDDDIFVVVERFPIFVVLAVFINLPLPTLCVYVLLNRGVNNVLLILLYLYTPDFVKVVVVIAVNEVLSNEENCLFSSRFLNLFNRVI
jgi:hypothetical protein